MPRMSNSPTYNALYVIVAHIPAMTNILLCHGSDDIVVPVKDICSLQSHLSHARTALRIITNADHNYRHHTKEICQTIAHYFSSKGRKEEWTRRTLPNWKAWVHAVGGVLNFRTVGDIWIPSTTDGTMNYLRPGIIYRCAEYVDIPLRTLHLNLSCIWPYC